MSKTISGSKLADRSKIFFSRLDSLARKTNLIVRRSAKFSAEGFTLGILKAVITGKASFNQLAMNMGLSEPKAMARQALHQRVDQNAVAFMMSATTQAIKDRWNDELLIATDKFNRVIIEDSSQAKTDKRNAEDFPGHGNGKGVTAGCKIDLAFDLLTGEPILEALHMATQQDREIGKDLVDLVKPFDLILRDMGYFSTREFDRIESQGAFWLSRMPVSVMACDLEGRKLETILRTTKAGEIDCIMYIGNVRHLARLIAVRATPEVARERRRVRREQARQVGKQPTKDMLTRDGWHIIITNVGEERMKTSEIFALYSVRWQIEIIFRAWKQSGQLVKALARRSNPCHLQTLMYGAILLLILTLKTAALLHKSFNRHQLSIEKLAHDLASFILTLVSLYRFADYNPDPRHLQMDARSRKSQHQTALECLS
jgi:hypothetical protein